MPTPEQLTSPEIFVAPPSMVQTKIDSRTAHFMAGVALEMTEDIYVDSLEARGRLIGYATEGTRLLQAAVASRPLLALRENRLTAVAISGLPVDPEVPAGPLDGGVPYDKKTFVSELVGLAIANAVGWPSLIIGEKNEQALHQIIPVAGREETQSNEGQVPLMFHQDLAPNPDYETMPYDKFMPDWLVLTGVRLGEDLTQTYIANLADALSYLSMRDISILMEKRFYTRPPDSFMKERRAEGLPIYPPIHSVLKIYDGQLESAFDLSSGLQPVDKDDHLAQTAINRLAEAFDEVKQEIIIAPGTAVAFNNRRVVHGRGGVAGAADSGNRRWIQRVYAFNVDRIVRESMGKPWGVGLGGGAIVPMGSSGASARRMMELSRL